MGNHVIYDRVWVSKKLARCSREAALAYPTIFLVADEWGRFEYRPHLITNQVFGPRQDYSPSDVYGVADVTRWLAEYERVGLLIRYHIDDDLAVWTKFKGRPPAKRRKSDLPDPRHFPEYRERLATIEIPSGKVIGSLPEGGGKASGSAKEATSKRQEQEQETGGKRREDRSDTEAPAYSPSPAARTETAIREKQVSLEGAVCSAASKIGDRTGRDPPGVVKELTAYVNKAGVKIEGRYNPAGMSIERLEKSLADAEAWLSDLDKADAKKRASA